MEVTGHLPLLKTINDLLFAYSHFPSYHDKMLNRSTRGRQGWFWLTVWWATCLVGGRAWGSWPRFRKQRETRMPNAGLGGGVWCSAPSLLSFSLGPGPWVGAAHMDWVCLLISVSFIPTFAHREAQSLISWRILDPDNLTILLAIRLLIVPCSLLVCVKYFEISLFSNIS